MGVDGIGFVNFLNAQDAVVIARHSRLELVLSEVIRELKWKIPLEVFLYRLIGSSILTHECHVALIDDLAIGRGEIKFKAHERIWRDLLRLEELFKARNF